MKKTLELLLNLALNIDFQRVFLSVAHACGMLHLKKSLYNMIMCTTDPLFIFYVIMVCLCMQSLPFPW